MATAPVFLEHPSSLAHDTGRHPEQAARIVAIERELDSREWLGFERVRSPAVERSALQAVHSESYIAMIEQAAARGGAQLDLDTIMSEGSFDAARHAAGGAVALVDGLLEGSVPAGFSAHRPPGHHAEPARAMGFCLFNNIAVAARHALDAHGLERVLILDWDVHHGNGTNDIFAADPRVLFCSIHQSPLWPGSGAASDVGTGDGRGFTVNLPVGAGSDDAVFRSLVDHVVVPLARGFAPQLILISAGYDAHRDDPLADCGVTEAGYAAMTASMRAVGGELGAPVGAVLEGGYALVALARSVAATMEVLGASVVPASEPAPVTDVAREAADRLGEWWPQLAPGGSRQGS
ncbi:MAG TPA: histone deacetylase [Solirubrobacteraceae bacterium]|jgi:acetoin utilization deacetylase AcuC-like enzyme